MPVIGRTWTENEYCPKPDAIRISDEAWERTIELACAAFRLAELASPDLVPYEIAYSEYPGATEWVDIDEATEEIKPCHDSDDQSLIFQKVTFWPVMREQDKRKNTADLLGDVAVTYYFTNRYTDISVEIYDLPIINVRRVA